MVSSSLETAIASTSCDSCMNKGCIGLIVTKSSAAALAGLTALSVAANDTNVCKIHSDYVNGYVSILGQLAQWIKLLAEKKEGTGHKYSIYIGSTYYDRATITNNAGFTGGNLYSTKEKGIVVIGSKRVTYNYGNATPTNNNDEVHDEADI